MSGTVVNGRRRAEQLHARAGEQRTSERTGRGWWALVLAGGSLGILTATVQTVERIAWAEDPDTSSICDLNASLSCTAVFDHWQSSALGIPNSLIAIVVFAVVAGTGLAGLLGSRLDGRYLASVLGLTVFMAGFVTWYMAESAYSMKVLCLYCLGCAVNILLAGAGLTRAADAHGTLVGTRTGRGLRALVRSGGDLIVWGGLALVIAAMLVTGLVWS
jgi:uncharacterized membrane protein